MIWDNKSAGPDGKCSAGITEYNPGGVCLDEGRNPSGDIDIDMDMDEMSFCPFRSPDPTGVADRRSIEPDLPKTQPYILMNEQSLSRRNDDAVISSVDMRSTDTNMVDGCVNLAAVVDKDMDKVPPLTLTATTTAMDTAVQSEGEGEKVDRSNLFLPLHRRLHTEIRSVIRCCTCGYERDKQVRS